jgi:hypothetical protein
LDIIKSKLEQLPEFQTFDNAKDPIRLLREVMDIMCGVWKRGALTGCVEYVPTG